MNRPAYETAEDRTNLLTQLTTATARADEASEKLRLYISQRIDWQRHLIETNEELAAATARADENLAAVLKYGKHLFNCARNSKPIRTASHPDGLLRQSCDCGFEKYWEKPHEI